METLYFYTNMYECVDEEDVKKINGITKYIFDKKSKILIDDTLKYWNFFKDNKYTIEYNKDCYEVKGIPVLKTTVADWREGVNYAINEKASHEQFKSAELHKTTTKLYIIQLFTIHRGNLLVSNKT